MERQINDHLRSALQIPKNKPSMLPNPNNWNWTAILTWIVLATLGFNVLRTIYNSIF